MRYIDPGKFRIGSLELSSDFHPDLELVMSSLVLELNIYESMFDECITGNIVVNDSRNILAKLPIVGYETVKVVYYIDEEVAGGTRGSSEYSNSMACVCISFGISTSTGPGRPERATAKASCIVFGRS